MKIDKQIIDDLNHSLVLTLDKEEMKKKVKSELSKIAKTATMKGFRKGKTPLGMLKKMYGQQVLMDVVNNSIQESIGGYLKDAQDTIVGQPIPAADQEPINFDVNKIDDYVLRFDVGVVPDFEVAGVSSSDSYTLYDIEVAKKSVDEELDNLRSRLGEQEEVEDVIAENDMVFINADELDGDSKKENGWSTSFSLLVGSTLPEEYKEKLLGLKKGDTFNFDVTKIEKDKSEEYIDKYLLNRTEADTDVVIGNDFTGEVDTIRRLVKAEVNQEFFDKIFGESQVSSEEEAREKLSERIKEYLDTQSRQWMQNNIYTSMTTDTQIRLPEAFLKRWLLTQDEKNTPEKIDEEWGDFELGYKWMLIRDALAIQKGVKVHQEEVRVRMEQQVASYFGQYGDMSMLGGIVDQMMQNQEEVQKLYDGILVSKILDAVSEDVVQVSEKITQEDFEKLVKEQNAELNQN